MCIPKPTLSSNKGRINHVIGKDTGKVENKTLCSCECFVIQMTLCEHLMRLV